jgi:hypothetical protein
LTATPWLIFAEICEPEDFGPEVAATERALLEKIRG